MCKDNKCTCCQDSNFVILEPGKVISNITKSTGDSRAIRIGNDIKLDVTILELNGMDIINIKAIKCIIVNTTPMLSDHCGTAYEVHRCGLPTYHIHPTYLYWGYGMHPFGPKNWHHGLCPHYDYFCRNPYGRYYLKPITTDHKPFEFIAPVKALPDRNKVRVFFPASAQMLCGLYSLTFVIDLYEPGYHCNNLRTITVDYNNIFELVPNMEGAAGDITIDIDKQLGVNVFDDLMFGNVIYDAVSQNEDSIKNITIIPVEGSNYSVRVGKSAWFKCVTNGTEEVENISWRLYGNEGCAQIPTQSGGRVLLNATGITNPADGEDIVYLEASTTDGGTIKDIKPVSIHNYASRIELDNYGSVIQIGNGAEINVYAHVVQEDGTRFCPCEADSQCQIADPFEIIMGTGSQYCDIYIGTNNNNTECEWSYNETEGNQNALHTNNDTQQNCCNNTGIIIRNTNNTDEQQTATFTIKSRLKNNVEEYPQKEITLILDGKGSSSISEDHSNDIYVNSGSYSNGTLTLNLNASDDVVTINGLPTGENPDYWYTGN